MVKAYNMLLEGVMPCETLDYSTSGGRNFVLGKGASFSRIFEKDLFEGTNHKKKREEEKEAGAKRRGTKEPRS